MQRLLDAITYHHSIRAQWHRGVEVELIRRADLVDAAPAVFRFGLDRTWLRACSPSCRGTVCTGTSER